MHFHGLTLPAGKLMLGGVQAVQLFYVLSGFLITLVLCEKYQGAGQRLRFYRSRLLRVLPLYWLALLGVLGLALATGELRTWGATRDGAHFLMESGASTASSLLVLAANLLLPGADALWYVRIGEGGLHWAPFPYDERHNGATFLLIMPAFSLALELYFYAIAPFVVTKLSRVWAFTGAGLAYLLALRLTGTWSLGSAYYFFPGEWFFFGMGALAYHAMRGQVPRRQLLAAILAAGALMALCFTPVHDGYENRWVATSWASALLAPLWLPPLMCIRRGRIDRFLGDLSYPVYLMHYPLLLYSWGRMPEAWRIPLLLAVAALVVLCIERPLERRRGRLA